MAGEQLDWRKLLDEALATPGSIQGVYDRFYPYSYVNCLLLRMQGVHEPIATYKRWQALGRQVLQGSKAREIIKPLLVSIENEQGEKEERLVGFKPIRAVFPLSETTGDDLPPAEIPRWDLAQALGKLGVREVVFDSMDGNTQGYSEGLQYAINPVAVNPNKTRFHELGHIILGHTLPGHHDEYLTHRGVMEFEAEATAYLTMNELELMDEETASHSRGYIQHWLQDEQPPDESIRRVFRATEAILRAGCVALSDTNSDTNTAKNSD